MKKEKRASNPFGRETRTATPAPRRLKVTVPIRLPLHDLYLHLLTSTRSRSPDCTIMTSSSREKPIDQYISGLTVSDGARLFAGTANNTTNNIYNGAHTIPKHENKCATNVALRSTQFTTSCHQGKTTYVRCKYHFIFISNL